MSNLENNRFEENIQIDGLEENNVEKKSTSSFFENKVILKNFLLASITLPVLFFLYLKFLDIYTLHDRYIIVPDFSGYSLNQLDSISDANNLRFVIIDSISDLEQPKGIVINQEPKADVRVKK